MEPRGYRFGNTVLQYTQAAGSQRIGCVLIPAEMVDALKTPDQLVDDPVFRRLGLEVPAWQPGSIVHLHIRGDRLPVSQGLAMRNSPSIERFRLVSQEQVEADGKQSVVTVMRDDRGIEVTHTITQPKGYEGFVVTTAVRNAGDAPITLEYLSSFSLDMLSPFQSDDGAGKYYLHRYRSAWSLEGRHSCESLEALQLERAWAPYNLPYERYGQIGSFPVRKFFPYGAIEDREAGVIWGGRLAWNGSWQMVVGREANCVTLSGGLADYEFGHWAKTLAPGESFEAPAAHVGVVKGSIQDLNERLVHLMEPAIERQPAIEQSLPVVFNEWCTTWGQPTHEGMSRLADRLQGSGVKYLVIDAGWTHNPIGEGEWGQGGMGDWQVDAKKFPEGLKATTAAIRERGLIPGIWFEFEVTTEGAEVFGPDYDDLHLKRDGHVICNLTRSFWDFRKPAVVGYLSERVIAFLRDNDFGYMKVDYNGTIGPMVDGAESGGEGLRAHLAGVQAFFRKIRDELPELIIENCSSGGHRLEPSMMALTAMSSFSDAHESPEIPVIAANNLNHVHSRQNQVWAVLHETDSMQRLHYSLAATFLGRMCLSGDVDKLTAEQWQEVQRLIALYQKCVPMVRAHHVHQFRDIGESLRHPEGIQAVRFDDPDGQNCLVVAHSFAKSTNRPLEVTLPEGEWSVAETMNGQFAVGRKNGALELKSTADFAGTVIRLARNA